MRLPWRSRAPVASVARDVVKKEEVTHFAGSVASGSSTTSIGGEITRGSQEI